MRHVLLVGLAAIAAHMVATAAPASAQPPSRGINWVAPSHVHSVRGADVYRAYCAVCHGAAGRGDGRAAARLTVPVPDLSRITERDGRFQGSHVRDHIVSTPRPRVAMPDWREVFSCNYPSQSFADLAMYNVTAHIESLQASNDIRRRR